MITHNKLGGITNNISQYIYLLTYMTLIEQTHENWLQILFLLFIFIKERQSETLYVQKYAYLEKKFSNHSIFTLTRLYCYE